MSTMGFLDTEWPQEGLWHMEVEPTGLPFMGCALSWVLRDAAHTADSPHRLSMKCTLQRKNSKKKIPQDSKVVLFSGKKKKNPNSQKIFKHEFVATRKQSPCWGRKGDSGV